MKVYLVIWYIVTNFVHCFGEIPDDCDRYCPTSCYDKGFAGKKRKQSDIDFCLKTQLECGCARLDEDAARRKQHMILGFALMVGFFVLIAILFLIRYIRVKYYKRDPNEPIVIQCACTDYIARKLGTLPTQPAPNTSQSVSIISQPCTAQPVPVIPLQ